MKSFQRTGFVWLVVAVTVAWALAGCQRAKRPSAGTTTADTEDTDSGDDDDVASGPESSDSGTTGDAFKPAVAPKVAPGKLVAIDLVLPAPAFKGTPTEKKEPNVEPPLGRPRSPFLAPLGTINLARGKPASSSDPAPTNGEFDLVTDGDKEATDFGYVELHPGAEWVQIDLGQRTAVYAVVVWHDHTKSRVYRDVIVQISDDPDFLDARTVFNNDYDNSSGLGVGEDMGYVETSEGKLIDCRGIEGRYIRLHSKGNITDAKNHYTEVEVYGRPAA